MGYGGFRRYSWRPIPAQIASLATFTVVTGDVTSSVGTATINYSGQSLVASIASQVTPATINYTGQALTTIVAAQVNTATISYAGQAIDSPLTVPVNPATIQYLGQTVDTVVSSDTTSTVTTATISYNGQGLATNTVCAVGTATIQYLGQNFNPFTPSTADFVRGFRENIFSKLSLTYTYNEYVEAGNWKAVAEAFEDVASIPYDPAVEDGVTAYQKRAADAYHVIASTSGAGYNDCEPGKLASLTLAMETHAGESEVGSWEYRLMRASEKVPL